MGRMGVDRRESKKECLKEKAEWPLPAALAAGVAPGVTATAARDLSLGSRVPHGWSSLSEFLNRRYEDIRIIIRVSDGCL